MKGKVQMNYSDSARGVKISRSRALRELGQHGISNPSDVDQFYADLGFKPHYAAHAVLRWLGY